MKTLFSVKDLGVMVRAKRKQDGLTQSDVAAFSGVGIRFVSELERGKPTVRMDRILEVLNGLGLELVVKQRGE
ncbi:MAG: helix-turn-helix transcriptional regulator [Desulfovibrionales bacterium]